MEGSVKASAPSNIAFVKYWGKFGRQYPLNPSISMTLSHCKTITKVHYRIEKGRGRVEAFLFEGSENEAFLNRIEKFLKSIADCYPLAHDLVLNIESENTFPHSAGIASSASAMAALCSCLVLIEKELGLPTDNFNQRISFLSRLASGSACRSVYSGFAFWGESHLGIGSNQFACKLNDVDEQFNELFDCILIVSGKEKEVSSSAGHNLMNGHIYKEARIEQANENFRNILSSMKYGDFKSFGNIIENEALSLHAMMMTSDPSFILLHPNSISIINKIKKFRKESGVECYFTIDAGPNIHLIGKNKDKDKIENFLNEECKSLMTECIWDEIGEGIEIG